MSFTAGYNVPYTRDTIMSKCQCRRLQTFSGSIVTQMGKYTRMAFFDRVRIYSSIQLGGCDTFNILDGRFLPWENELGPAQ